MNETERPGGPGDQEQEGTDIHPTPDDVPDAGELGIAGDADEEEEDGPDTSELDKDPAYNPDDPELKGLKGG